MSLVSTLPFKALSMRELPAEEWSRLEGTDLGSVVQWLDPAKTRIGVVEDGGEIVGCWSVTPLWHAEGIYIHPSYRRAGGVMRRLLRWLWTTVGEAGATSVITGATDPTVAALIERLGGVPTPGQSYLLPVKR